MFVRLKRQEGFSIASEAWSNTKWSLVHGTSDSWLIGYFWCFPWVKLATN